MKNKLPIIKLSILAIGALVLGHLVLSKLAVQAAELTNSYVSLSDSRPDETSVSYTFEFDNVTTSTIKCIQVEFDTQADGAGGVPTGMTTTSASVNDGSTDYIPTPASWTEDVTTNGTMKFTYATGEAPAASSARTLVWTGITNGSTADTGYFAIFNTYNNTDCATSGVDNKTVMFIFTSGQSVSLTVDPSLSFSIASVASSQTVNGETTTIATTTTTIPLGTVTTSANAVGAHDLTVSTNASGGYTVYTRYTAAPTNGASDTISDHSGTNASPSTFSGAGTEAFGYTTDDSTLGTGTTDRFTSAGGNKWAAFTTGNLEVAYSASAVSSETTRTGYQVGIDGATPAGTYTTTVIYTATPTY